MRIRTKSTIIFLILSLMPLAIIGAIVYQNGKKTIEENLGVRFRQNAHVMIDRVDRSLYEVYNDIQTWTELDIIQEIITNDIDSKISSFFMELSRKYGHFSFISALNNQGEVVASSDVKLIGKDLKFKLEDFYKKSISGKAYVEDAHLDEISKDWVVSFSFPVKAKFEKGKNIGFIFAGWKVNELTNLITLRKREEHFYGRIMIMRNDGLVLFASQPGKENTFKLNLINSGLTSALLASQKKEGYLVESDQHNIKSLIAYHYSRGYRDFPGLGWAALVSQDIKTAYEPIEQLKIIMLAVGALVGVLVVIISLIVTRWMTNPILKISQAARKVASGDFEEKIDHASNDEIGYLAKNFNQMTAELKENYQKLKDTKQFLTTTLESLGEGILVLDKDFRIQMANQFALKIIEKEREEVVGGHCYRLISKRDETCSDCAAAKTFNTGQPAFSRKTITAKDGSTTSMELYSYPIIDAEGKVTQVVEKIVEVSARIKMEEQLRQSEKLAAVGLLASGVAHEVGNPLTSIFSLAQVIERKSKEPTTRKKISLMKTHVDRISKILHDFLNFSRPTPSNFINIDIQPALESTVNLAKYDKRIKKLNITTRMEDSLPKVYGSPEGIQQVFLNLILNAADAVKDRDAGQVDIFVSKTNGFIHITFRDNGIGMSKEEKAKIFEPFYTTREPGKGMGLGLFVSYGIIKSFGGEIVVESEKGKGTSFNLRLPISNTNRIRKKTNKQETKGSA